MTAKLRKNMNESEIIDRAFSAFATEVAVKPPMTLRGGNAVDEYLDPPPFAQEMDKYSDAYFEKYFWGIAYLDPLSWRHYLPRLFKYALVHRKEGSIVVDALLNSLRPPDRDPPRLASLSIEQEASVTEFLDELAFGEASAPLGLNIRKRMLACAARSSLRERLVTAFK